MTNIQYTLRCVSAAMLVLSLTSCLGEESWQLDSHSNGDDSGWERLRSRQYLRYTRPSGEDGEFDLSTATGWGGFRSELLNECSSNRYLNAPGAVCTFSAGAGAAHCEVYKHLCVANLLEMMAGVTSDPVHLGEPVFRSIPSQSTATNALLHELAATEAREAAVLALDCLGGGAGLPLGWSGCVPSAMENAWGPPGNQIRYGRSLATAVLEALQLADEATHSAVRDTLALADGHYSSATTTADA